MRSTGSRHVGFSSCSSQALEHRLSRSGPVARGIVQTRSRACVLCHQRGVPLQGVLPHSFGSMSPVYPLTLYRSLPTHQAEPHAHPIPSVGDVSWPRGFRHIPGRTSPTAASPGHHAQQHSLSCGSHVVGLSCRFPALADAETPPSWASVSIPYCVVLRPDHLQQGFPNSGI